MPVKKFFKHLGALVNFIYINFISGTSYIPNTCQVDLPIIDDFKFDQLYKQHNYQIRIISSKYVNYLRKYRDWLSLLNKKSKLQSPEELINAIEELPEYRTDGQLFFPTKDYEEIFDKGDAALAEWVHFIEADNEPTINFISTLIDNKKIPGEIRDKSLVILHKQNCH